MNDVVHLERVGATGLIGLNNPPVNAASHALRQAILEAVETLEADPEIDVIALYGKGRSFIAGADIREFGKPPKDPWLPALCNRLEACAKPVISVLHGAALGGGLEVALGTHARIAVPGVAIGLPEVTLGIIPGAGGTQRTPRLTGIPAALDLITTGRHIDAEQALALGLVDRIATGDPRDLALQAAVDVRRGDLRTRRTGDLTTKPDDDALAETAAELRKIKAHLFSPHRCVEAVAASTLPLQEGLARERALFQNCLDSPQRAGLIHAFFAERAVAKIPEAAATPRDIGRIGVIGAGTMGSGIATACLLAGFPVTLVEKNADALERGQSAIAGNLDGAVRRGKLTSERRDTLDLTASTDMARLDGADLVIEAAFEDMEVKKQIIKQAENICPGAILATNTSYLDVNDIAAAAASPGDVIGLHFFSPAHVMRLLEVVVGDATRPEVVATGFALAKRLRKIAVRAGVCDGFIGNRIMNHYRKAADHLMMDGASPEQIDAAIRGFGFAMGPFEMSDLAGLDIGHANRRRQDATRPEAERYVAVADRLVEAGWLGRKTGKGFYLHGADTGPNPDIAPIIEAERAHHGVSPRPFTDEEIVARYLTAMISEAARVYDEGIALRPIDVDAVLLFGYGFPRHHGGPLHHADTLGAARLVERIETYATEDAHFWQVPAILRRMAAEETTFADLNREG
ncbi:3-hydroxyacyl-CoA dehydrogenase [Rhodophyticola porphyridii]|uniref:3-hydroxyacyl-CoA dehydrogenase n=2 Tax=Rhodophyticola porphyridii TaxID=1852017 RepID=A0A3L9XY45_9RHOB|nr:3-hydroxyacyl-CoA dehydrogenase [Rhodophyticola porphyridii]